MRRDFTSAFTGRAAGCAALGALVFFTRAWLARVWGSPLPFADQWDAEAIGLYAPWLQGTLHWSDLFKAHNEHRIVLTRLADLALFAANGGWNPWAQLLLNAGLHAATAATLAALFWPALPPRGRVFFAGGLAVLFTVPAGWQNALYGFQSGVYFVNLLGVAAIAGLSTDAPLHRGWSLGWLAALLAVFANAGGVLVAVAAFLAGLVSIPGSARPVRLGVALGLVAILAITAVLLGADAPQHVALHARNVGQFFAALAHGLAWPWVNVGWAFIVMQLPLAWLVADRWRRRVRVDAAERAALALGLFALLQSAAVAYTRGAGLPEFRPLSRYQDPLLLGAAGQVFALWRMTAGPGRAPLWAGLLWTGAALAGLISLTETNLTLNLPFKRLQDRANLAIVRAYAETRDPAAFTRDPDFSGPHPDPRVVQRVLDDPALRATLPAEVLAPEGSPAAVLPWLIRHSRALTGVCGVLWLGLLALLLRGGSDRPDAPVAAQPRPD